MAYDGANLEMTPMNVTFDSVDLGGTEGGVSVSAEPKWSELKIDQLGDLPIDYRLTGVKAVVKMTLAEIQKKDNWKVAFPFAELKVDALDSTKKAILFTAPIGDSLLAHAKVLKLHPLSKGDTDLSGDFKFYKAAVMKVSEIKYQTDKQAGLEVEFGILPDTSVSPPRVYCYGDPAVAEA